MSVIHSPVLKLVVTQTADQPDITNSLLTSDGGYFDISSLSVGQVVGSANLSAAAGEISFESILFVESVISSNQAVLTSINVNDNSYMGTFTISNTENGISIFASPSYSDDNNITAGNSSNIILNNIFVNPDSDFFNIYTSVDAEVGPSNSQTFTFNIDCPCIDSLYVQNITLCHGETIFISKQSHKKKKVLILILLHHLTVVIV